jgi:Immunity protein 53
MSAADDRLASLQAWFQAQCDGDWEHQGGVIIETLDNPGWQVSVTLAGTSIAGATLKRRAIHRDDLDWLVVWVEGD